MTIKNYDEDIGQIVVIPVIRDWKTYGPTTSLTNTTLTGRYKRNGTDITCQLLYAFTGTPAGVLTLTEAQLLNGLGELFKKSLSASARVLGSGTFILEDTGVQTYQGDLYINGSGNLVIGDIDGAGGITLSSPFAIGNGDFLTIEFTAPIDGWETHEIVGAGDYNNYTPSLVRKKKENLVTTLVGATTSPAVTVKCSRIDDLVNLTFTATGNVTKNGSAGSYSLAAVLAAEYRPTVTIRTQITSQLGLVTCDIKPDGNIDVWGSGSAGNIPAGTVNSGWVGVMTVTFGIM